jgi:simple sugar transport system permease protein
LSSLDHVGSPFHLIPIPILSHLPLVGPAFFRQSALGYFAWLLVPCCAIFLSRTTAGLNLRAVGEHPQAADDAGVNVTTIQTVAFLWGGGLAGLAGAFLSIDYTNGFAENMTAGRGFIALAVVILGRWTPAGVALAALLFGMADALHYQLLSSEGGTLHLLPYQTLQALPYVLTLMALLLRSRLRTKPPAFLGQHYTR